MKLRQQLDQEEEDLSQRQQQLEDSRVRFKEQQEELEDARKQELAETAKLSLC